MQKHKKRKVYDNDYVLLSDKPYVYKPSMKHTRFIEHKEESDEGFDREDTAYSRREAHANQNQVINGKIRVSRQQLNSVMKSKLDIYTILTKEGQYYLPPLTDCTMEFIKDIMTGKKKVSARTHSSVFSF